MTCTNAYDTITQAAGGALGNTVAPDAYPTSYCRTTDGIWIAWFNNDEGNRAGDGTPRTLWPSLIASSVQIGVGFFPDDGTAATVYELSVDPVFRWGTLPVYGNADPCSSLPIFGVKYANVLRCDLDGWSTDVLDVQVRTDGSNVWVVVLARESVDYPWLYGPSDTDRCGNTHPSLNTVLGSEAGDAFNHDTSTGYRWWQHFGTGATDDGGPSNSFRWEPARVTVWGGDLGGFTKLDTIEAQFDNSSGLVGGIEAAASPAEPGVCHLVWGEAGDYGYASAPLRGQRINYTQWDTSSKILDTDLLSASESGTGDVSDENWIWTAEIIVRNDHGSPIAIVWPWNMEGGPIDVNPAAQFWDISGGTANVVQTLDLSLVPTAAEAGTLATPVVFGQLTGASTAPRRNQFASSLYTDPRLSDTDVYLLCVAYGDAPAFIGASWGRQANAFYRIPCDGSAPFDYLDGIREVGYSIVNGIDITNQATFGSDFVSDPDDVWMPQGVSVQQLDRQCLRGWRTLDAFAVAPITGATEDWSDVTYNRVSPPSIVTRDDGDWIVGAGTIVPTSLVAVASIEAKICRCCAGCNRTGMHVWEII